MLNREVSPNKSEKKKNLENCISNEKNKKNYCFQIERIFLNEHKPKKKNANASISISGFWHLARKEIRNTQARKKSCQNRRKKVKKTKSL